MSSRKHRPIRTCAGCGGKFDQSTLMRLASHDGALPTVDEKRQAPGRGVWLCRKSACVERAWQRQAITRSLKLKVTTPEDRQLLASLKIEIDRLLGEME